MNIEQDFVLCNFKILLFMKKKSLFVWSLFAALFFGSCSNQNDNLQDEDNGNGGSLKFTVSFDGTSLAETRAKSTAIPTTSWSNVKQLQILLYDASGIVRYSTVETPTGTGNKTFNYTNVPSGTYTIVAVANTKSTTDNVTTYGTETNAATANVWDEFNVRQKNVSGLLVKHKTGVWPTFIAAADPIRTSSAVFTSPAEVFSGSVANVVVSSASAAAPVAIALKREVSLMRVRMNVAKYSATVDFTADASILIYRLPNQFGIVAGATGGVSSTSTKANVIAISGGTVFNSANPTTGYNTGGTIVDATYTLWRDVIVFPNNGGRSINGAATALATPDRQYFIAISGKGKTGHKYADGSDAAGKTVYWYGLVKENFTPNSIRDVNLTLETGGSSTPPTTPLDYGDLTIAVNAPEAWNSNIVESSVIM